MKRYVSVSPRAEHWSEVKGSDYLARTVIEPEQGARETGLLDAQGNKLVSIERMDPIGFIRPRS